MFRLIILPAYLLFVPIQSNARDILYDHTIDIFQQPDSEVIH